MPTAREAIRRLKGVRGHVAVAIWSEADVITLAHEHGVTMGRKSAQEILETIDDNQDCEMGISWGTLASMIEDFKVDHPHYRRCEL